MYIRSNAPPAILSVQNYLPILMKILKKTLLKSSVNEHVILKKDQSLSMRY